MFGRSFRILDGFRFLVDLGSCLVFWILDQVSLYINFDTNIPHGATLHKSKTTPFSCFAKYGRNRRSTSAEDCDVGIEVWGEGLKEKKGQDRNPARFKSNIL